MRRLQLTSLYAGVAGNELAEAIVAQQARHQRQGERIGDDPAVRQRPTQLRENPPARAPLPEHGLVLARNLVPGVALAAALAIAKDGGQFVVCRPDRLE